MSRRVQAKKLSFKTNNKFKWISCDQQSTTISKPSFIIKKLIINRKKQMARRKRFSRKFIQWNNNTCKDVKK